MQNMKVTFTFHRTIRHSKLDTRQWMCKKTLTFSHRCRESRSGPSRGKPPPTVSCQTCQVWAGTDLWTIRQEHPQPGTLNCQHYPHVRCCWGQDYCAKYCWAQGCSSQRRYDPGFHSEIQLPLGVKLSPCPHLYTGKSKVWIHHVKL